MNGIKTLLLLVVYLAHFTLGHLQRDQFESRDRSTTAQSIAALHADRRSMAETDMQVLDVQRLWVEWNFCTNAYPNPNFTEANEFVPETTVFLAGYPTGFKNNTATCNEVTTRIGEIGTGKQTIFFPLVNYFYSDAADDYELGLCGSNTSEQAEAIRYGLANDSASYLNNETTKDLLLYKIDDENQTAIYIYDNRTYYLQGCSDNRTSQEYYTLLGYPEGDTCDEEPNQQFNGLVAYPMFGWYGNDTRVWVDGESHTYEFGTTGPDYCITAKYILTAKGDNATNANNNTAPNSTDTASNSHKFEPFVVLAAVLVFTVISVELFYS